MAPYDACATILNYCEVDGITPHFSVRNFCSDMLGLVRAVNFMTGLATPSSLFFIDMQMMEILVTISKVCQSCGNFIESNILIVTLKTYCIVLCFIRIVELWWEVFIQYLRIG